MRRSESRAELSGKDPYGVAHGSSGGEKRRATTRRVGDSDPVTRRFNRSTAAMIPQVQVRVRGFCCWCFSVSFLWTKSKESEGAGQVSCRSRVPQFGTKGGGCRRLATVCPRAAPQQ